MDKMKMKTANKTLENLAKLKEMFPEVITETKDENGEIVAAVDAKKLEQLLSTKVIEGDECYDFTWVGKKQAMVETCKPIRKTLRPCREESVDWENTQNLYIEGDNLDVLKLLQESYLNKVKMIYIDPPYNTGNDSFIYPDDYSTNKELYDEEVGAIDESGYRMFKNTETNGRFHSSWCSMMYPRLKLARNLLTEDGVIFISIDDNEVDNLKKMCDEVFGEDNFVTYLEVELSLTQGMKVGAAQNGAIVKNGEFVVIYAKNRANFKVTNVLYDGVSGYDSHFSIYLENIDGKLQMVPLGDFLKRDNKDINIYFDRNSLPHTFKSFCELIEKDNDFKKLVYEKYAPRIFRSMMASVKIPLNIQERLQNNEVVEYEKYILHQVGTGNIRQLLPLSATLGITDDYESTYGRRRIRGDMWKGFYADMMNVAKEGSVDFKNGKKPVRLLKQLTKWGANNNSIILDFFSGSATTAHAVMQLNAEDGGKRKFIMVQLPEICDEKSEAYKAGYKNICEIGKERIRRAGKKIVEETGKTDLDIGFRVLKLDSSNMKDVYYAPADYKQTMLEKMTSNIEDGRTAEDLLYACMLEWGVELSLPHKVQKIGEFNVHIVNDGDLVACFDDKVSEEAIKQIAEMKPLRAVFRDSSFATDAARVNVGEIFKLKSPNTTIKVL